MRNASKALLLAGITSAAFAASVAQAQTAAPATPEHTLTGNVGLFSEYIFRGISQTAGKPALQGGFDYAHASGFYLGTWGSNISWLEDFGAYSRSSLEWDFYGGFKSTFPGSSDWTYDVGLLYYYYPGKAFDGVTKADTFEGYVGIGWKWLSAKFSYNFKDYFGAKPIGQGTDGTYYVDISAAYPLGDSGANLLAHYGIVDVKNDGSGASKASYDDWRLGVSYVIPSGLMKDYEIGAYYSGNNAEEGFYTDFTGYNTAKNRGVFYVKKSF